MPQELMTYCMLHNPDIRGVTWNPKFEEYHVIVAVDDPYKLPETDLRHPDHPAYNGGKFENV